jgi:hypothetical protein
MKKEIVLVLLLCCIIFSCGKKGDPEYKEHKNETEIQINIVNKA